MASTTYLHKNQGTPTNAKKFTVSCWFKRSDLGTAQRLFQGYKDGNDRLYLKFGTDDKIMIFAAEGGTDRVNWTTNRVFRDTNAWYHLVLVGDSTESTEADRIKLYINGVQETAFTKTTTSITLNMDWGIQLAQSNNTFTISGNESHGELFDGYISHFHYVDGTAYQASTFGSTDSTTGEWKINSSPTLTMGDNGFTILKNDNTVTDQSSNSNDWAVGAGTLTKSLDNPSNIYCVWNRLTRDATGTGDKFNLYYGNTEARSPSVGGTVAHPIVGTIGLTKGKWYYEALYVSGNSANHIMIGITSKIRHTNAQYNHLGALSDDWAYHGHNGHICNGAGSSNTDIAYGNTYAAGDYVGVFIDLDNNKIYFSKNGTVQNSGTGQAITAVADTHDGCYYPAFSDYHYSPSYICRANFGNGVFGTTALTGTTYDGADGNGIFKYDPKNVTLDGVSKSFNAITTKGLNA